jgi:hypothetical protein
MSIADKTVSKPRHDAPLKGACHRNVWGGLRSREADSYSTRYLEQFPDSLDPLKRKVPERRSGTDHDVNRVPPGFLWRRPGRSGRRSRNESL